MSFIFRQTSFLYFYIICGWIAFKLCDLDQTSLASLQRFAGNLSNFSQQPLASWTQWLSTLITKFLGVTLGLFDDYSKMLTVKPFVHNEAVCLVSRCIRKTHLYLELCYSGTLRGWCWVCTSQASGVAFILDAYVGAVFSENEPS